MIGPPDVVKAATNLQSHATSNVANVAQRAALAARQRRPVGRRRDARRPSTGAGARSCAMLQRDPRRRPARSRRARSTPTRRSRACSARRSRGRTAADVAPSWPSSILDEAEVAVVPGEAFGTPGYVRLSYALGDDDLVEGVARLHKLLGEAPTELRPEARLGLARDLRRAAEGAPAPALHRVDAARDAASSWPTSTASAAGRAAGRRLAAASCRRPTSAAGSASSGCTTSRASVLRTRGRRPPAAARGGRGRGRRRVGLAGDPGRPQRRTPPRFGGLTAVPRAGAGRRRGRLGRDGRRHRRDRRAPTGPGTRSTRGPWPGWPRSTPAAGVVGFGLSNDERRGRPRTSPRRSGSPDAGRAAARPARRRAARRRQRRCLPRRSSAPTGSATASARSRTRELLERLAADGVTLEVCPSSNVRARGLRRRRRTCRCARCSRPASRWRSARTTRCCSGPGWLRSTCWRASRLATGTQQARVGVRRPASRRSGHALARRRREREAHELEGPRQPVHGTEKVTLRRLLSHSAG